ncbi:MAG: MBOAT family protein [Gammaproteobacteria bacterium]|nr:MBOAT family protein [Gammaproteobacteria bacterium]
MVFSSAIFLFVFLPLVLTGYYLVPRSLRNAYLLAASLGFYAWGEGFLVLLMLTSVALNYAGGRIIDACRAQRSRKIALGITLAANLLLLGWFKYANFIADNMNVVLEAVGLPTWGLDPVHLPIGISFFTFQAMSYVVDIYRGDARVQTNPVNSALYIALFPQLIAGPIVRYHHIDEQLRERSHSLDLFAGGVVLFVIGLGKKMLIANPMGEVSDRIFAIPADELTASVSWIGAIAYTLQIYFDFSGYSDMAIGLGRMFGFQFLINFNYPYISRSMREFWRRWHISLSRWFRDYLYIPLGGNRVSPRRVYVNLLVVFFLCGLWHGASWNFVIWGLIHGAFLAGERTFLGRWVWQLWRPVQHAYVLFVVIVAWVFFRAETLDHALLYLAAMFGFGDGDGLLHHAAMYVDPLTVLILVSGFIGSTPVWPALRRRLADLQPRACALVDTAMIGALMLLIFAASLHLAAGTHNPFIYFRF